MRWLGHRLTEAGILIVLATALGLMVNAVRRDPLPLNLPGHLLLTESGARVVFLSEAQRLYDDADYVFVDARDEAAFLAGHIEGALSLPTQRFAELYPELKLWTAGQPLLLYGDAGNLLTADDLAIQLLKAGEARVLLLAEGLNGWLARGYPVATGSDGLLTLDDEEMGDAADEETWDEETGDDELREDAE
jgi:rhodanese-related sulfurtransferase